MADDSQDDSEKTEEPTQRKLDEALKKGQVATSKEVNNLLLLMAFTMVILWMVPTAMGKIGGYFSSFIQAPHLIEVSKENMLGIFTDIVKTYAGIIFPIMLAAVAAALVAGFGQHPPVISTESMKPKLEKISPLKGLKKMFSMQSVTEFLKGLFKIIFVGVIAYTVLSPLQYQLDDFVNFEILGIMGIIQTNTLKMLVGVLSFLAVMATVDFIYQKFEHAKNLKMSHQDIKEEYKQTEGDPHVKAKLKQIRMERVRKRMMAAVPEADVVVTNPTHFSIALKYSQDKMAAPLVVAKGMDLVALKIREIAEENDVPLIENPPLARALYDAVDVDEEIPLEFYQAVAEVISTVYKLKHKEAA
jgi:flagellar biosynthetic protein FlhB